MGNRQIDIKVLKADQVDIQNVREQMGMVFAEGFTQWLHYFSKDQERIAKAFAHSFQLEQFYLAIVDDKVAGMVACTTKDRMAMKLNKSELRKHLGFIKGTIAGNVLKKEFEAPFHDLPANTGSIEFVATAKLFRGIGVASKVIQFIMKRSGYKDFLIEEVADNNEPAIRLYEKIGFEQYKSKPAPKQSGFKQLLSFKFDGHREKE